ncbi:Type 1 glutamine amidotransferase-like domain-containing protein [Acutalibacter sp. 1XD8-36]|uniref:Type 1 glutamine amidotransferase-like domain-containing protein n=1 Tax=Acutalibacter sp. 1XD8-36 TaxID=2320852 RepID=UPI0014123A22|nr:Type 1 glutamine amidotransferase-like domain-containing protein [Acutalibacter sp. 1XD8-36]NBJ88737.1 hypothetical protein [Acutalibacter sp. 1XD8-36]
MRQRMLGFFSGFPSHHFPFEIAEKLKSELAERESIVFVSAWPEDYERNDSDLEGMYEMFTEQGMDFRRHRVIDSRAEACEAAKEIREASCIFLMGGHPGLQLSMIQDMGLAEAVRESGGVVLGVSAGAINMALRSLDTKESPVPYEGLGLADITVKPHFEPGYEGVLSALMRISDELPICAMEDNSAIFVEEGGISFTGQIHWIERGAYSPFSPEKLKIPGKN